MDKPSHRCSWCLDAFDFIPTGTQAISLPCGHTFCRCCLQASISKQCYVCRTPFIGNVVTMAIDYYIKGTMVPAATEPDPLLAVLQRFGVEKGEIKMLPPGCLILGNVLRDQLTGKSGLSCVGTLLGVQVAIKTIPQASIPPLPLSVSDRTDQITGDSGRDKLARCHTILRLLRTFNACSHVACYLGVVDKGNEFCIVMPLYSHNLAAYIGIQPGHKVCLSKALLLGMDIARAMCDLHSKGFMANSMTPENVLVDDQGRAFLADFHLTMLVRKAGGKFGHLTGFKSPEETQGYRFKRGEEQICQPFKADIWAFACLMIYMLTGRPPLKGSEMLAVMLQATVSWTRRDIPKGIPKKLSALLRSCLELYVSDRPTAPQVLQSLREISVKVQGKADKLEAKQRRMPLPHHTNKPRLMMQKFNSIASTISPSNWFPGWKKKIGTPPQLLVMVTSHSVEDVMLQMQSSTFPTIYDFQGQEMIFSGQGTLISLPGGVTWRNGTIVLRGDGGEKGQGLIVAGTGVVLSSVCVIGGLDGVTVASGGSLTMKDCKILDCCCGLRLGGNAILVASNLRLLNCSDSSFSLHGGSTADVIGCEVRGSFQGVYMNENSSFVGTRMSISDIQGVGLSLHDGARLSLSGSSMDSIPGKPGVIKGKAKVLMFRCTMDGNFETDTSAAVQIEG